MDKQREWNRREFIVKPIVWAGAASVLGRTDLAAGEFRQPDGERCSLATDIGEDGHHAADSQHGGHERRHPGIVTAGV